MFWNGKQISSDLAAQVSSLSSQIVRISQQHLAYPMLHAFRSRDHRASAPHAIAVLDDALLLLSVGVCEDVRPEAQRLIPLRRAVEGYVNTVNASVKGGDSTPRSRRWTRAPRQACLSSHTRSSPSELKRMKVGGANCTPSCSRTPCAGRVDDRASRTSVPGDAGLRLDSRGPSR